jgi:hypothetical protein
MELESSEKVRRINKFEFIEREDGSFASSKYNQKLKKFESNKYGKIYKPLFRAKLPTDIVALVREFCDENQTTIEKLLEDTDSELFVIKLFEFLNPVCKFTKKEKCDSFHQLTTVGDAKCQLIRALEKGEREIMQSCKCN